MLPEWPRALGEPPARALIRVHPDDFYVDELLGFEPGGEGEHAFLHVEKRGLNTADVVARLSRLSDVPRRDIGFAGMKDRNAVTRQWFSVGLAGRPEPDWSALQEDGSITVLASTRHRRKLRRGSHRGNRFRLRLSRLEGDRAALEQRLAEVAQAGVPNYFGEQRFGRGGETLRAAKKWVQRGGKVARNKRGLYLSALRALLFNELLARRVAESRWTSVASGGVCTLAGSNSYFYCAEADESISERLARGDIHPGLPLWGREDVDDARDLLTDYAAELQHRESERAFLLSQGLDLAWRATRLLPDDFSWQFCDDGRLQLDFALGVGSYATALLAECVHYGDGSTTGGRGDEQG